MKKWLSLVLALVLAASLLAGCGAVSKELAGALPEENGIVSDRAELGSGDMEYSTSNSGSTATVLPENQKMVRKVWLEAETEAMDPLLADVEQRIADLGGYIESQNLQNGSKYSSGRRYRYADLTIRIPADKLDSFVGHVSEASNITSKKQTAENITLSYVATESKVTALQTEQTRLLELLAKADSMSDILTIEKRLTEVRADLEEYTSQLRVFDNQVDYGTVYLNIREVVEFTVVEEEPETVWQRIGSGFMESLENLGNFFVELFVFLIVASPYLIPLGLGLFLVIYLTRKKRKNAPKRPAQPIKIDLPDEKYK